MRENLPWAVWEKSLVFLTEIRIRHGSTGMQYTLRGHSPSADAQGIGYLLRLSGQSCKRVKPMMLEPLTYHTVDSLQTPCFWDSCSIVVFPLICVSSNFPYIKPPLVNFYFLNGFQHICFFKYILFYFMYF